MTVQPDNSAKLSICLADDNNIPFVGQQTHQTANKIVLSLTSLGNVDAQGPADIRYGQNNLILSISANGALDSQPFFIQSSGQQSTAQPPLVPPATAVFVCTGQMQNGWQYRATVTNQRFTEIRWERPGAEPTVSTLRFVAIMPRATC